MTKLVNAQAYLMWQDASVGAHSQGCIAFGLFQNCVRHSIKVVRHLHIIYNNDIDMIDFKL